MTTVPHVSASQVSTFKRCQRSWFFSKVMNIPSPSTPAQERGKAVHTALENYLHAKPYADDFGHFVTAAAPHLSAPGGVGTQYVVEHKIEFPVAGATWLGYIDFLEPHRIVDFKTRSDFRYNLTPTELTHDVQMVSYAHWYYLAFPELRDQPVVVEHLNLLAKAKSASKCVPERARLTYEGVQSAWASVVSLVEQMLPLRLLAATAEEGNRLPPAADPRECVKYGGCPYRQAYCKHPDDIASDSFVARATGRINSAQVPLVVAGNDLTTNTTSVYKESPMNLSEMMSQSATLTPEQPAITNATLGNKPMTLGEVIEKQKAGELPYQQPAASPLSAMMVARAAQPSPQAQAALAATEPPVNLEDRLTEFQAMPITPPDMPEAAPVDPWDPATQSAAMDQVVGEGVGEPVKKKRGRPKKNPDAVVVLGGGDGRIDVPLPGQTALPGTVEVPPAQTVGSYGVHIEHSAYSVPTLATATEAPIPTTPAIYVAYDKANPAITPAPRVKVQAVKGFTLYLNAIPTKGDHRDIMLAEDFVAPLMQEIAAENGVSDARQIKFEWNNLLTAKVLEVARGGKLPEAIIICGYGKEQDALLSLTPYAEFIVKGV